MAQLDGTGCPVWHGLIELGMNWAPSLAQFARSPSALAQWPPAPLEESPGHRPGTASGATTVWEPGWISQGCNILGPGCSQGCHVPGLGCPQGCSVPSRMRLSPGVSHPSTRVSLGMFYPRASMSQGCHIPGQDFPRSVTSHTGMSPGTSCWHWAVRMGTLDIVTHHRATSLSLWSNFVWFNCSRSRNARTIPLWEHRDHPCASH